MKKEDKIMLRILIAFACISVIFFVLSYIYNENLILKILQQLSLCLTTLFLGLKMTVYGEKSRIGYIFIGAFFVLLINLILVVTSNAEISFNFRFI